MKTKQKSLFVFFTFFYCLHVFADSALDSFVAASITTTPKSSQGLSVEAQGLFAGQYYLSDSLIIKGDFKIETTDLSKNVFSNSATAQFTIQELSTTYRFKANTINQQLSLFLGEFESFGSDTFVNKFFGANNFSSMILVPHLDIKTNAMYRFSGLGAAYTIKLQSPTAFGIYSYVDEQVGLKNLNADFRYANKWDFAILDFGLGLSLPMERIDSAGKKVFLLIDHAIFHGGFSLLLGNNPITNLFIQAGITKYQAKPDDGYSPISLKDIYIFMEPRFTTNYFKCNVAFFFLPDYTIKNLRYIEHQIGCNLTLQTPDFTLFKKNTIAGLHFTVSFPSDILTTTVGNPDFQVSVYSQMQLLSGSVDISAIIKPKQIADLSKFINFTVGYKTSL